jgi:hypothetical protein
LPGNTVHLSLQGVVKLPQGGFEGGSTRFLLCHKSKHGRRVPQSCNGCWQYLAITAAGMAGCPWQTTVTTCHQQTRGQYCKAPLHTHACSALTPSCSQISCILAQQTPHTLHAAHTGCPPPPGCPVPCQSGEGCHCSLCQEPPPCGSSLQAGSSGSSRPQGEPPAATEDVAQAVVC